MRVKEIQLHLATAENQASYFFSRDTQAMAWDFFNRVPDTVEINLPSDAFLCDRFIDESSDIDYLIEQYRDIEQVSEDIDDITKVQDFRDWLVYTEDFEEWAHGRFLDSHYPMWGTVWIIDDNFLESVGGVDGLYECGIGMATYDDGRLEYNAMFIAGAGYNFYEEHWIPLFKKAGYIQEEAEAL